MEDKLKKTITSLNKKYGEGTIKRLGDDPLLDIPRISSGILSLDLALGGGYPTGRIVEIYGQEGSGKTAIATYGLTEIQKTLGNIAVIDVEQTFNPAYAAKNGMNIESLYWSQPETGEQAMDIAEALALSGVKGILYDSVAATMPKHEGEKDMGDPTIGTQAKLMSQCLRRLNPTLNKNNCTIFFVNQLREKVGVMYGNPEVVPGGRALKFYASIRLSVRPVAYLKEDGSEITTKEGAVGHRIKIRVEKNKVYTPFKIAEFDFYYGIGVDQESDIINVASDIGVITKTGSWYSYEPLEGDHVKAQGLLKFKKSVRERGLIDEVRERTLGFL